MIQTKKLPIKYLAIVLFFIGIVHVSAQGPWSLPKGSGFAQFQAIPSASKYKGILQGAFRDVQGINRETWNADYGFYGQYSATDKIQVIGLLPIKHVSTGAQTDSLYFPNLLPEGSLIGLSNIQLAVKYGILSDGLQLAVSLQSSLNSASFDLDKGLATGLPASSVGFFVHVGGSVSEKSYAFIDLGFQNYTNNYSDAIQARIEYGVKVAQPLYLILGFDIRRSLKNGSYYNENLIQTALSPNDQGWIVGNVKANYETKSGIGFNFGFPLIPIRVENVGFTGSFAFGIYKKWVKE